MCKALAKHPAHHSESDGRGGENDRRDWERNKRVRNLWILAMVNVGIWAVSIIALVFVMQHFTGVKRLFPILAGRAVVAIDLLSALLKSRQAG